MRHQFPIFPIPARFTGTYNSNSFVSGVIQAAGGMPPSLPLPSPIYAPGYTRPVPIYNRQATLSPADIVDFFNGNPPYNPYALSSCR